MRVSSKTSFVLALFVTGLLAASPGVADKPDWAGNGKPGKGGQSGQSARDDDRRDDHHGESRDGHSDVRIGVYFNDRQRTAVHDYYEDRFQHGHCPPGLAKKRNGCMPPGQAKKWQVGHPLPRDVTYYEVPSRVVVSLGVPPSGYKYVRVAGDILLIAIGTGMVVDAIGDLGRM